MTFIYLPQNLLTLVGIISLGMISIDNPISLPKIVKTMDRQGSVCSDFILIRQQSNTAKVDCLGLLGMFREDVQGRFESDVKIRDGVIKYPLFPWLEFHGFDAHRPHVYLASGTPNNVDSILSKRSYGAAAIPYRDVDIKSSLNMHVEAYPSQNNFRPVLENYRISTRFSRSGGVARLVNDGQQGQEQSPDSDSGRPAEEFVCPVPTWMIPLGLFSIACCMWGVRADEGRLTTALAVGCGIVGVMLILAGYQDRGDCQQQETKKVFQHGRSVAQEVKL